MGQNREHIVLGVLLNQAGQCILTKRPDYVHQGGLWEFPGGKVELNENIQSALTREIQEELGIVINNYRPLIKIKYDYPDKKVLLDTWVIDQWSGQISGRQGEGIIWVDKTELCKISMPAANKYIINALNLPFLYLICPDPLIELDNYIQKINSFINAGLKLLQLRFVNTSLKNQEYLYQRIADICESTEAKFLLNTCSERMNENRAHGIHLTSYKLMQLNKRPLGNEYLVAASCHNMNELIHAEKIGVDFVVVSPVEKTRSHPHIEPIGWDKFADITNRAAVPVYALGGMTAESLGKSWHHGGQGISMLSGIWSAENPESVIRQCI